MEIMVAKHAGFCFGVKRAIEIAKETAAKNTNSKTYVYGQLVHNERVISDLENQGIVFVEHIRNIPDNAITVLRAHGEPGTTYSDLAKKNIAKNENLRDATCPLVTLVHNVALKLKQNGYEVVIFGKKNHPEGIGIRYHIKGENTFFIEKPEDAMQLVGYIRKNDLKKVAIISQTTMSVTGYSELIEGINAALESRFEPISLALNDLTKPFVFVDTICNPTKQRQLGTEEIAKEADVMVVIGGRNSSNSKELAAKSKFLGAPTYFIQDAKQLQKDWFLQKNKIGVSAGASTPDITIHEVVERIKELAT